MYFILNDRNPTQPERVKHKSIQVKNWSYRSFSQVILILQEKLEPCFGLDKTTFAGILLKMLKKGFVLVIGDMNARIGHI